MKVSTEPVLALPIQMPLSYPEPRGLETLGGAAPPELLRSKRRTVETATSRVRLPNNLYSLFVNTERVGPLSAVGKR